MFVGREAVNRPARCSDQSGTQRSGCASPHPSRDYRGFGCPWSRGSVEPLVPFCRKRWPSLASTHRQASGHGKRRGNLVNNLTWSRSFFVLGGEGALDMAVIVDVVVQVHATLRCRNDTVLWIRINRQRLRRDSSTQPRGTQPSIPPVRFVEEVVMMPRTICSIVPMRTAFATIRAQRSGSSRTCRA